MSRVNPTGREALDPNNDNMIVIGTLASGAPAATIAGLIFNETGSGFTQEEALGTLFIFVLFAFIGTQLYQSSLSRHEKSQAVAHA